MSIKLQRIIAHIAVEVYGFKSFAKLLRLGYVFFKKESFESLKEILNEKLRPLWTEVSKYKASRWSIFPRLSLNKIRRKLSIHSIITVIHFSRAMKLYRCFYKIISRNNELCQFWSVDYSSCFDFRYFLFHSTTPRIKLSCKSVNWQYAVISGPAVT